MHTPHPTPAGCGVRDRGVGCGVCEGGVWGAGCGVWGMGCGVWGVGCGVWGVGNGVWGVRCGEWDVGCGICKVSSHRMRGVHEVGGDWEHPPPSEEGST